MIARKHMKEESLSYQTGTSSAYHLEWKGSMIGTCVFSRWKYKSYKHASPNTFGGPKGKIVFDFNDMQIAFHLEEIEMNLIHTWCL